MNKIMMTFGLGMLVGAVGIIQSEIKQAQKSKLKAEVDNYDVSYIVTEFSDGDCFVRGYYKLKEQ